MASADLTPASNDGYTLVELLVAMTLMLLVLAASLSALVAIQRGGDRVTNRANEISQARVALERMTRELRQATVVRFTTSQVVELDGWVHLNGSPTAVKRTVRLDCTAGRCTRAVGAAAAQTTIANLVNTDVFAPTPSSLAPTFLGVKVTIALGLGAKPVTLSDGVDLRNGT